MAIKIQKSREMVYRGINLYESELILVIKSLEKSKLDGSKELVKHLTMVMESAIEE